MMTINVVPKFGTNYKVGYFGFTKTSGNIVSGGITLYTGEDRMGDGYPAVSHVFIVTGENECVEALANGVVISTLDKYFNNPKVQVFFRKPRGLTLYIGEELRQIAYKYAEQKLKYGYATIAAHAINRGVVGQILNGITFGGWGKLTYKLGSKGSMVCSEVCARMLQDHPKYKGVGCLRKDAVRITPDNLMQDDGVFTPWKNKVDSDSQVLHIA